MMSMHHVFVKKKTDWSSLKVAVSMRHVFPNRNWSSLKVAVSMYHVFVNKKVV